MTRSTDNTTKDSFGRRVKERRAALGMSQADLAKMSDTRQALISAIERGEANPTFDSILRIAIALQVSAAELLGNVRT
jgi:transcriptional regulator with XRE-family HTH domain